MRGRRGLVLAAVASSLLSALAAVVINVATGGTITAHAAWLWALIAVLVLGTAAVGLWQQRLQEPATLPAAPATALPAELPARLPVLQGRAADLTAARSLLAARQTVLISGPPGIGKSAFALDLAHQMSEEFRDGQLFADLGGADADRRPESSTVLMGFLAALGEPTPNGPLDPDRLPGMFRSAVSGKRVLVLLDDAADTDQVRPLLPGSPGCRTLVTSRSQLTALDEAVPYDLDLLSVEGARALLGAIAGPARIDAEPAAADEIISMCGRLPLALRVAAALLRSRKQWRCEDVAGLLRPESTRLLKLQAGDLAVRTVFSSSYDALGDQDQRAFRRLGVFPGPDFSIDAAAAMIMTPDPAVHLSALADAQLVEALTLQRYRLHDLMRLFARERLDAEEGGTAASGALARLVAYYSSTAPAAGPAWITAEAANIVAAARRALADGDLQAVLGLAAAAHGRLLEFGRPAECAELGDSAVQAARLTGDRRALAAELTKTGEASDVMGFVHRGVTYLAEALSLWQELGDTQVMARTEAELGNALRNAGDHRAALGHLEHALASYRELGDEAGEIVTLNRLGTLYNVRFDQRAIDVLERAAVIGQGSDFVQGEVYWTLTLLGPAYVRAGRFADAHRVLDEALAGFRSAGDRYGTGYTLLELGFLGDNEGDYATGARYHQEALDVFRELRAGIGTALAIEGLAGNLAARGEEADALATFRRAASMFAELGDQAREGTVRLKVASVLGELGDVSAAETERQRAEALLEGKDLPEADAIRRGAQLPDVR